MSTGEKIHKSLRIARDLAERIKALGKDGESETATYCRVLEAGAHALEGDYQPIGQQTDDGDRGALVSSLQAHIETLKADNARLGSQLEIKDRQIEALSVLTAQAQQTATKALEAPKVEQKDENPAQGGDGDSGEQKRGFLAWLFG